MDRSRRRSRRRRLRRVQALDRERPHQPGLEGFAGLRLPRRRPARRGPDRAVRGAGLRLRRQAHAAAHCSGARSRRSRATALRAGRERSRERFETAFWCEELGTYALALDGDKRPAGCEPRMPARSCFSGIAAPRACRRVADGLMDRDFFTAGASARWRIGRPLQSDVLSQRLGLAARQRADRPGLRSLRPEGHDARAVRRHLRCRHAIMDLRRLPELFCGFRRGRARARPSIRLPARRRPGRARRPWLLQACLGLEFRHAREQICFRQPRLPEFLERVEIRRLRVGASSFDIMLRRSGADVSVNVLDRQGDGRVDITL